MWARALSILRGAARKEEEETDRGGRGGEGGGAGACESCGTPGGSLTGSPLQAVLAGAGADFFLHWSLISPEFWETGLCGGYCCFILSLSLGPWLL